MLLRSLLLSALVAACAHGAAVELTIDNYATVTAGKNAFVRMRNRGRARRAHGERSGRGWMRATRRAP